MSPNECRACARVVHAGGTQLPNRDGSILASTLRCHAEARSISFSLPPQATGHDPAPHPRCRLDQSGETLAQTATVSGVSESSVRASLPGGSAARDLSTPVEMTPEGRRVPRTMSVGNEVLRQAQDD